MDVPVQWAAMLRSIITTSQRSVGLAWHLRRRMTSAEQVLWKKLRARRFHGLKFRRQAPLGPYIVDFLCVKKRLVIEIDGASHLVPGAEKYDAKRDAYLQRHGFTVLRFGHRQTLESPEIVLERIALFVEGEG
jgi:very-short-patch-repair endonuclease